MTVQDYIDQIRTTLKQPASGGNEYTTDAEIISSINGVLKFIDKNGNTKTISYT